jgi:hypothetical protein
VLVDITNGLENKGRGLSHFSGVTPPPFSEPQTKHATTLTLNSITSVPWGKAITVTGKLTDNAASGAGVRGATITFDGTGANNLPDVVTNSDGTFTVKGASPSSVATGWKVQAHFAGNSDYAASNSVIKTYSTTKHSVTLSLSVPTDPVPRGTSYKVSGTLTDSTVSKPLASKTITFTADDPIKIAAKTTNTNGYYSSTQTAPNSIGTYDIQSHFAGDSRYNAKDSSTKTLTVSR